MRSRWWFQALIAAFFLALALLAARTVPVQAGPPAPFDFPVPQPDGTEVTVRLWGDEWQFGYETPDGYTLVEDPSTGFLVYAEQNPDGTLAPALRDGIAVRPGETRPEGLQAGARPAPDVSMQGMGIGSPARPNLAPIRGSDEAGLQAYELSNGNNKMLVILASFQDVTNRYPASAFQSMMFGTKNSVSHYYREASGGRLAIVPAAESFGTANDGVVGWVKLPFNHPNNGSSAASYQIARGALQAADKYVNFAAYDTDGDGYVTGKELQVVIFTAGYEISFGTVAGPAVWAHQYFLDRSPLKLDGKWVAQNSRDGDYGGYVITGERHGDHRATMGTVTHEVGHLLAWPDLYDTKEEPTWSQGVGRWSIMGSGSWNGVSLPGDSPALPDAWLKWYQGWDAPIRAANGARVGLQASSAGGLPLVLGTNTGGVDWDFTRRSGTGEFWLVENRQQSGYDAGLPGCGLLVWHIDETVSFDNDANAYETRPLMELEQADGLWDLRNVYLENRGDVGDPYPGTWNNLAFNNLSKPNSRFNNGSASNYALAFEPGPCASTMYVNIGQGMADLKHKVYLPMHVNGALTVSGSVVENGKGVANTVVYMMFSTQRGANASIFASATTDAKGNYNLPLPPLATANSAAFAYWSNTPSGSNTRAAEFACNMITLETPMLTASPCVMEVTDIKMVSPAAGATINYPATFQWTRRPFNTDSYAIEMWNTSGSLIAVTNSVGYSDRATVAAAPPSTTINTQYNWSVRARTPSGIVSARYYRPVFFRDLSGPALGGALPENWYAPDALMPPRLEAPIAE
jgi:M6 family metalloprotease-like protein